MLKLFGAVLLTGGGLALGLGAVNELSRRLETLTAFSTALGLLERELVLRAPSTPELLETLAERAPAPANSFFAACQKGMSSLGETSFQAIWTSSLSALPMLEREDRDPLLALGASLGRYDAGEQRRAAEQARRQLEEAAQRVWERRRREGRSYGALGLSLGLFATILLL